MKEQIALRRESGPRGRRPELAIRKLLFPFKADAVTNALAMGMQARGPPSPGLASKNKLNRNLRELAKHAPPGGTGLKEALALLSKVFKSRAVKSRPPNVHIMWETVLGRKEKEGELCNWKHVAIQTQDCTQWKLHSAMFCGLRKMETHS